MADIEALVLQMSADIRKLEKGLAQARATTNTQLKGVEDRFDQMNANISRSQDRLASDLRRSVAAIGVALSIDKIKDASDQWINLRNTVLQYADVVGPVGAATSRLNAVATDAGISVGALGVTFGAASRAARNLGASGDDVFNFNEAVAKGAAIANTGVAAVDGALTQLGQSIGSPKAQLQEFNSIIEGTPRLAQAFADGITAAGGSVSKLRALIAAGDISGADLFKGLLTQLPKLREEFAASEGTIGRSMTRLNNAFLEYVGGANQASGATRTLTGFIDAVAGNFDRFADAAVVAASVLGGALAAGAIVKLITNLGTLVSTVRTAETAMIALRAAMAFFGGPVGAAILAIGAGLLAFSLNGQKAAATAEDIAKGLADLKKTQASIQSDTAALTAANERLNDAIAAGGHAAQLAAQQDIAAIEKRIAKNKEYGAIIASNLRAQIAELGATGGVKFQPATLTSPAKTVDEQLNELGADIQRKFPSIKPNQSLEEQVNKAADEFVKVTKEQGYSALGDKDRDLFLRLTKFQSAMEDLRALDAQLKAIEGGATGLGPSSFGALIGNLRSPAADTSPIPTSGGSASNAALHADSEKVRGYETALEKLQLAMKRIGAEADVDNKKFSDLKNAMDFLNQTRAKIARGEDLPAEDYFAAVGTPAEPQSAAADAKAFADKSKSLDEDANFRSRKVVDALLDYIHTVSLSTDAVKAFNEAKKTGILLDVKAADGLSDIDRIQSAIDEKAFDAPDKLDLNVPDPSVSDFSGDLQEDPTSALANNEKALDVFFNGTKEYQKLRDGVRTAVKDGFKQGVETGDWGKSAENILAQSLTSALDDSLNELADILTQIFVGSGQKGDTGWVGGAINAIGSYFTQQGGRASGGQRSAWSVGQVNEQAGEFLFMGKNPGQVLTAAQVNGLSANGGGGGGPVTVNSPITFNGPVDSTTLPAVQRLIEANNQKIVGVMPRMIDARVIDSRKRRRL